MYFMFAFVLYFCAVHVTTAQVASSLESVEQKLELYNNKMQSFRSDFSDTDSLEYYSFQFDSLLFNTLKNDPTSIHYTFKKLQDNGTLWVASSEDGKLKIYSWDDQMGGTMRSFNCIYQFETPNGVVVERRITDQDGDPMSFYSKVYTLKRQHLPPVYLAIHNGIYSTKDASQSVSAFAIENGKLNKDIKIFKTRKEYLNTIDVYFDFFSVAGRPERPLELITFDKAAKKMYIPIVVENGQVTKRNIVYQFDGTNMKHILTEKK